MYINNHKRSSDKKVDPSVVQNEKVFSKSQTRRTKTPCVVKQVLHSTTFNLLSIHFQSILVILQILILDFKHQKLLHLLNSGKEEF